MLVSGPVLAVTITTANKTCLLLGDRHEDADQQTGCGRGHPTIDRWLLDQFSNATTETPIDLFVENATGGERDSQDSDPYANESHWIDNYILAVNKLFFQNLKFQDEKVVTSSKFPNLRCHLFNFRAWFGAFILTEFLDETADFLQEHYDGQADFGRKVHQAPSLVNRYLGDFETIVQIMRNPTKTVAKTTGDRLFFEFSGKRENFARINKLMFKLRYDYKHPRVQQAIVTHLDALLDKLEAWTRNVRNEFKIIQHFRNADNAIRQAERLREAGYQLFQISIAVTDLFLLRRFLDKDYVTTAIVYAGYHHTAHITWFLQNFNPQTQFTPQNFAKALNRIQKPDLQKMYKTADEYAAAKQCVELPKQFPKLSQAPR